MSISHPFSLNRHFFQKLFNSLVMFIPKRSNFYVGTRLFATKSQIPSHFPYEVQRTSKYQKEVLSRFVESISRDYDVIITGGGISGITCAYELSKKANVKTALFDRNLAPGGTMWLGSQSYGPAVIRKPVDAFLKELQIPLVEEKEHVVIIDHIATYLSTVMSKMLLSGNVSLFNGYNVVEYVIRGNKVEGVAANNSTMEPMLSPYIFNSTAVVSACGFWQTRGESLVFPFDWGTSEKNSEYDLNETDDALIHYTQEVKNSLILAGGEVSTFGVFGKARPSIGALIQSGRKAADLSMKILERERERDQARPAGLSTAGHFIGDKV